MTTEVTNPRPIGTLLKLDTYQGMTDEEIELVIQHHVEMAKLSEEIRIVQAAADAKLADWQERSLATETALANVLQSNMEALQASMQVVQPNSTVFVPTEVSNV